MKPEITLGKHLNPSPIAFVTYMLGITSFACAR
jgi:hypothetical protein